MEEIAKEGGVASFGVGEVSEGGFGVVLCGLVVRGEKR